MAIKVTKTDVWAAEIGDEPGGLALAMKAIADYGADLECVVARRQPDKPGKGVVFVTPLDSHKLSQSPDQAGFHRPEHMATLKVEGQNRPGLGAEIAHAIGDVGVSMHGLSASVIGHKYVCFIGFDNEADAEKAEVALNSLGQKKHFWYRSSAKKSEEKEKVLM